MAPKATIKVSMVGEQSFARGIDRLFGFFDKDMRPAFAIVRNWWYDTQKQNFNTKGGSIGETWPALSDDYKDWKDENYPGRPLLVLTGKLKQAMTGSGSNQYSKLSKERLKVGIRDVPYWAAHNFGYSKANIPQRKFIGSSQKQNQKLTKRIQDFTNEVMAKEQKRYEQELNQEKSEKRRLR